MAVSAKVWTEHYAEMTHGKTRYFEAGTGYPTILIHGAGWTSGPETWAFNIGPLSSQLRVLAIDALNWGTGDVLNQEFSFAYMVDHIREFMDVLGIEKANVVGHSMGGWLVTLLAYESPNRVNKMVNVAGGGAFVRPLQSMVEFKVPPDDQIREQFRQRYANSSFDPEEMAAPYIKKGTLPDHPEAFAKVMRHMTNPVTRQRYQTVRRLPHIHVPTLVIWGRDDKVNELAMGEATASGIPGARLIVYDNTGHAVPMERPEEFNRDVLAFLAG